MNGVFITVQGVIGTEPKRSAWNGQPILTFRLVNNERKYDSASRSWVDVHSSWLHISCFGELAQNVNSSVRKGDRILVHGKMRVKDYVSAEGVARTGVDLVADAIGPDLKFAVAPARPARRRGDAEERMREHAEQVQRELDAEPRLSVSELIAARVARDGEVSDGDTADEFGELGDELGDEDDDFGDLDGGDLDGGDLDGGDLDGGDLDDSDEDSGDQDGGGGSSQDGATATGPGAADRAGAATGGVAGQVRGRRAGARGRAALAAAG
jgi:single-strand DNA-binding protein